MSKYSTHPQFLEFERLFGSPAADDLLQRIVEAQANHGDSGGDGVSLSVTETSIGCYDLSGYLDYAGQEMSFELSWGHGHGTHVTAFDFNADEVLSTRHQLLADATRDLVLGDLLQAALAHAHAALLEVGLELTPSGIPERLSMVFNPQRAAVCVPGIIRDSGLETAYPAIAQCELAFDGEACMFSVSLEALHGDEDDDELKHWASAFASTTLLSQDFKLDDKGMLDVAQAARQLHAAWTALGQMGAAGFSPLTSLEHQFAGSMLEACTP